MPNRHRPAVAALLALFVAGLGARAQEPLLPPEQWSMLRAEATGSAPYDNLRLLTTLHRVPGTPQFEQAAGFVLDRAKQYGLADVHAEEFPIDGKLHYGLMRSNVAWTVDSASLWQLTPEHTLLGDFATNPIRLADYSHTTNVETSLVDVGQGVSDGDYSGKDVRGKIVLADGVLSVVQHLAVVKYGAAGIVSDMPNQHTAWSGQDSSIVRWGHLDPTLPNGFAFMVSPATAGALRAQIARGTVTLAARVAASVGPGHWTVVSATIPGTDPMGGEIVYSCHLDHQRPGANDNASGCVTILEVARVLQALIGSGRLPRPTRTMRFLWGPEVEGTMAFLATHPEIAKRMRADIHMDMVGGDLFQNKSVLHVTETPWSLPTFVTDIGDLFAEEIRSAATAYTEDGEGAEAAVLEDRDGGTGTRNGFFVDETPYAEGSDHDDYDSSTIAIPSLYLRDWPDRYIHTDHDTLEKIDATKLRRVALLGAAAGYTEAGLSAEHASGLLPFFTTRALRRLSLGYDRAETLLGTAGVSPNEAWFEASNLLAQELVRETGSLRSLGPFTQMEPAALAPYVAQLAGQAATEQAWIDHEARRRGASGPVAASGDARVPHRAGPFGPLTYQNDNVLLDRLGPEGVSKISLFQSGASRFANVQDKSALYSYEILNFVDGHRSVTEIRNAVAAEFGPLPVSLVANYLDACEKAGIVTYTPH